MTIFLKKMSSPWQFFDSQMAIFGRVRLEGQRIMDEHLMKKNNKIGH